MKAYVLDAYGKGRPLRLSELPNPVVGPDDVLIEIHATALNVIDLKLRNGDFKLILPRKTPFILGADLAGIVKSIGSNVTRFRAGDAVYASPREQQIGTFAECIAVNQSDVAHKPENLSMGEAASIPLVGLTAWQVMVDEAKIQRGQKLLIHAGSGGVGTFAIQLARHLGVDVATTTSTRNIDLVRSLGADIAVDYKTQDFSTTLSGYDAVLHSLDADTLVKSLKVMKPGGKLISISGPADPAFAEQQGLNWFLRQVIGLLSLSIRRKARQHGVSYSFLFMKANGEQLAQITELIEAGTIRPVVDRIFPFDKLNDALAYLETGRARGKVVVSVRR